MTNPHSDTIEFAYVGRSIGRRWRAIATSTAIGLLAAIAVLFFAPPRFRGKATLIVKPGAHGEGTSSLMSQVTSISSVADLSEGLAAGAKSPLETEIEILGSRAVVGAVVDSLRLEGRVTRPRGLPPFLIFADIAGAQSFKPRTYSFEQVAGSDGAAGRYRVNGKDTSGTFLLSQPVPLPVARVSFSDWKHLPARFDLELRDREDAIDRLSDHLKVSKQKGEVVSIDYRGDDSVTAARVPNLITEIYLARRRTLDRGVNQRRVEFLLSKADSMSRHLLAADRALRAEREASGVVDPVVVGKEDVQNESAIRSKLTDVEVEQGALQLLMAQVAAGTISPRELASYPSFLRSPAVNNVVTQLVDVETQRTMRLETRTEKDPDIQTLTQSAQHLEGQLMPLARSYSTSLARERADLDRALDSLTRKMAALPKAAESSERLLRDVEDYAKLYAGLQAQIVEAKLAAITEGGDVRALDFAVSPKKPSFPQPLGTMAIGVAGGLLLGIIIAAFMGSVGRWMQDRLEVEHTAGVPTLAFDPTAPLLLGGARSRTLVVAPLEARAIVAPVVQRLAETAVSRSISVAVLDLSAPAQDVNATIARLEAEHDLVIVRLPSLSSDGAAAALRDTRPVLLVGPERRVNRARLMTAMQLLRRLEVPVAGIVLNSAERNGVVAHN